MEQGAPIRHNMKDEKGRRKAKRIIRFLVIYVILPLMIGVIGSQIAQMLSPKIEVECLDCVGDTIPISELPYTSFIPVRLGIHAYDPIETEVKVICGGKILWDDVVMFPAGDNIYTVPIDLTKLPNRNPTSLKIIFGPQSRPLAEKTILFFRGAWTHTTKVDKQIVKKGENVNISVTILNHLNKNCDFLVVISLWKISTLHPKSYDELAEKIFAKYIIVKNVSFGKTYTLKIDNINESGVYYIKSYVIPFNDWKKDIFSEKYDLSCHELNQTFSYIFGVYSNKARNKILNFCKNNRYSVFSVWIFSDQHKFTFLAVI